MKTKKKKKQIKTKQTKQNKTKENSEATLFFLVKQCVVIIYQKCLFRYFCSYVCNDVNSINTLSCKHVIRIKNIINEVMFVLVSVFV